VDGVRLPAAAFIGPQKFAQFHVDLVADGAHMTGTPDPVRPLADVPIPGLRRTWYLAYPLVDHITDKVVATFERYGPTGLPSTRYKDLVDLVVLSAAVHVDASSALAALHSEARRRGLRLPARFRAPDVNLWTPGYAAEARRCYGYIPATLDAAVAAVSPFLNPLLDGSATGSWDPIGQRWH
jgi:hypothetical protein